MAPWFDFYLRRSHVFFKACPGLCVCVFGVCLLACFFCPIPVSFSFCSKSSHSSSTPKAEAHTPRLASPAFGVATQAPCAGSEVARLSQKCSPSPWCALSDHYIQTCTPSSRSDNPSGERGSRLRGQGRPRWLRLSGGNGTFCAYAIPLRLAG